LDDKQSVHTHLNLIQAMLNSEDYDTFCLPSIELLSKREIKSTGATKINISLLRALAALTPNESVDNLA
jgi:hypothetical protein